MSAVSHPNIVKMLFYWYESAQDEGDSIVVLNLVLEFLVRSSFTSLPELLRLLDEAFCPTRLARLGLRF